MSLFQRLFGHIMSEALVEKLSDSTTFQRFAVRSTQMVQGAGQKAADVSTSVSSGVKTKVVGSVSESEAAAAVKSELDAVKSKWAAAKAEFVSSVKEVADKYNK